MPWFSQNGINTSRCVSSLLFSESEHVNYLPLTPEAELQEILTFYYSLGLNDNKIAEQCLDHFDREIYGLR